MNRFDRNERLFGAEGQKRIRSRRVVIAGCGGVGDHATQQLAFLGVGGIAPIDDEELKYSSLNRYVLARYDDPIPGTRKVDIAERAILAIDPSIEIRKVYASVRSRAAFDAFHWADTIFGCVDNDGARLVLTEFALAYGKDYFDLATDVEATNELRYGGRIVVTTGHTRGCPVCLGEIDLSHAREDLEDSAARHDREQIYGVDKSLLGEGGPAVVSLNGVVASLAVTEFMAHVTGMRSAKQLVVYRGHQGIVSVSKDTPASGCYYCEQVRGAGDAAGVERYLLP